MAECHAHDYRWDRQADERGVYLARLVRDLGLPVAPLAGMLREGHKAADGALEVLEALARAGNAEALEAVRPYAGTTTSRRRVVPRPYEAATTAALRGLLRAGDLDGQRAALRELNRRGPVPELPALLDALPVRELAGPLDRALELLGAAVLAPARSWSATPGHPLRWIGCRVLAAHGDGSDVPALLAGWDDLDGRCGYQDLAAGLARIGGPAAQQGVGRLHAAWLAPHSAERAACLRALLVLDPAGAGELLVEGLWDCEGDVRELAAAHASPARQVRDRLAELSGDPIETPGVRAAAAARLPGGPG